MMKPDPIQNFDTVAWTRAVRDGLHSKYADLPTPAFVRKLSEDGEASAFGRRFAQKFKSAPPPSAV